MSKEPAQAPKVGVAVIVLDEANNILLAQRISNHEDGKFGCPGGKVDFMENPYDTAIREAKEEADIKLTYVSALPLVANCTYKSEPSHFVCLWFTSKVSGIKPAVPFVEKNTNGDPKSRGWNWYSRDEMLKLPMMRSTIWAYDMALSDIKPYSLLQFGDEK